MVLIVVDAKRAPRFEEDLLVVAKIISVFPVVAWTDKLQLDHFEERALGQEERAH